MAIPKINRFNSKPLYYLQMLQEGNIFTWKIENFTITSTPRFNFISTNFAEVSHKDENIIELELNAESYLNDTLLTRIVLVEKIGNKKVEIGDPLIRWALHDLQKIPFINTRDFLIKTLIESPVERKIFLEQCVLLKYQTSDLCDYNLEEQFEQVPTIIKLKLKPKIIMQYP